MVKAIVYETSTGHTKQYAEMLSKRLEIIQKKNYIKNL